MNLFYSPEIANGADFLDQDESRHAIKSLRLAKGDEITIIDGLGTFYDVVITEPNHKKCQYQVLKTRQEPTRPFKIHIALAPTKNIDRVEWFVEKATEIGIDEITFLQCTNSERKVIKDDRILKKAISAAKQSLKASVPKINPITPYPAFVEAQHVSEKFIAYVDFSNTSLLKDQVLAKQQSNQQYTILIGPEGDFTQSEVELATQHGYKMVSLGSSRLRTETAGIIACHTFHLMNH